MGELVEYKKKQRLFRALIPFGDRRPEKSLLFFVPCFPVPTCYTEFDSTFDSFLK